MKKNRSARRKARLAREARDNSQQRQLFLEQLEHRWLMAFDTPILNFDGQGYTSVDPPDTTGDVGPNHYVQAVNSTNGTSITIYRKTDGGLVSGPFPLNSLATTNTCQAGLGDGIVLYDQQADRWMLSEFSSTSNTLCVYVSRTNDPTANQWNAYEFNTPNFPDFPKYGVWPDAYYVSTNEDVGGTPEPSVYALDRVNMLQGLPARPPQRFTAPPLAGFAFQALTPADLDGSRTPPTGAPGYFMRHRDDEAHNVGANDPSRDFLELWQFHADFATPANANFSLVATIPVSEFDSDLCGLLTFSCIPQPFPGPGLDPLREVIMPRLAYRNFGSYETLVGNLVTDVDGTDHAGVRWFELRRTTGGQWGLYQEGTVAPDLDSRWMGAIAMDGGGNMALGYSVSSDTTSPSLRYIGRTAADAPGLMPQGEYNIVNGGGANFSIRWGDYAAMSVDPVDDETFWFTSMYSTPSGVWQTRIASFKFATAVPEPPTIVVDGPRLVGVQPNDDELLNLNAPSVLEVSPHELVLRFDARYPLDAATLNGVQLTRTGFDDKFEVASVYSDFNTNGAAVVQFDSVNLGKAGNETVFMVAKNDLGSGSAAPSVTVVGRTIYLVLNTNATKPTTAQDLIDAVNGNTAAKLLVQASLRSGVATTNIAAPAINYSPLNLRGAGSATGRTNLNAGVPLELLFTAANPGAAGNSIRVNFTSSLMALNAPPTVTVSGSTINVTLNANNSSPTTAQGVVNAINNNVAARALVYASLPIGNGATAVGNKAINYSPVLLGGANDVQIQPAYKAVGENGREIIMRFAEALPDDSYRLEIFGYDNAAHGVSALKSTNGFLFQPRVKGTDRDNIDFQLDLGAQVISVVPQPVTRTSGGALQQDLNKIVVYFNEDDLDPNSARNPSFYQLINVADGSIMLPQTVTYDAAANTATLIFPVASLPAAIYNLRLGESLEPNATSGTALSIGSVFSGNSYQQTAFLGDPTAPSVALDANDVDLYRFEIASGTTITATAVASAGLNSLLRLFDSSGTPLATNDSGAAGGTDTLVYASATGGTFYLGVSSSGNAAYTLSGTGASGGGSTGSYGLTVSSNLSQSISDSNSSYATATDLGLLGRTGRTLTSQIQAQSSILMPPYTGGNDEPGHRDIPAESHIGSSGTTPSAPSTIPVRQYYFGDIYGSDPQGNPLHNLITENQKQRTREVFEILGSLMGMQFRETTGSGMQVVTGDTRVLGPTIPPSSIGGIGGASMVIMNALIDWGQSEYGGGWFDVALHEIGHAVGLGHSYDLPTIMGSGESAFGAPPGEPVFPRTADIIHLQRIRRPHSTDIDLFQFRLDEAGRFSAETVAERLGGSNLLNSVLTLFNSNKEVIARNDDYFSNDSFLNLRLEPGTYYIGVTSVGNESYDPTISDSGFGGRTDGQYQLKLNFTPEVHSHLVDTTGTAVDGDANRFAGGTFDFWFQAAEQNRVLEVVGAVSDGQFVTITNGAGTVRTFEFNTVGGVTGTNVAVALTPAEALVPATVAARLATAINSLSGFNTSMATASGARVTLTGERSVSLGTGITGINVLGRTIFVDKQGSSTPDGSLARPFRSINGGSTPSAFPNAYPGDVIRIVGNGGTDGKLSTTADNAPYLIGFDNFNNPLPDGGEFLVPRGATVMIDAGALLKLRKANLDVGSSAVNQDRSGGALQVLGTPTDRVLFRSLRDDTVGGDSDGAGPAPASGDWGGIVFRDDSDRLRDGSNVETGAAFLNWVNHADLKQGGGSVFVNSVESVFTPIHMVTARPTIGFNTITQSAGAAMSANPNAFDDAYGRVGPDIVGNSVTGNSINGLFLRINTTQGAPIDRLDVTGRFDDTDIVHVLTDTLEVNGNPGGPLNSSARLSGRLAIDPGVIIKSSGSRIEMGRGASQLIAEGTVADPIVFTSLSDDRYGTGGTFDTSSDQATTAPAPGQWGGLIFNAISRGSLDHVLIANAGGITPIEGNFDSFNPIEVHQATLRITNSILEDNAEGLASSNRNGRGTNSSATIFVRGAQPVIVNNILRDNQGDAISLDLNSLDATSHADPGRSTGAGAAFSQFDDNLGPLVRLNRMEGNDVNGMSVRGGLLTTESIWDDTDIVHVVRDEIQVLNHHTANGLRLQSSDTESLVVKLMGGSAGFTANGTPLDIDDRIGGTIQTLGTVGHPVVLTSLNDCTVGAGFTPDGQPMNATVAGVCEVGGSAPYADVIIVMDESGTMSGTQIFSQSFIVSLDQALIAAGIGDGVKGINRFGLVGFGGGPDGGIDHEPGHAHPVGPGGALFGTSAEYVIAAQGLLTNGALEDGYDGLEFAVDNYVFRPDAAKFLILATDEDRDVLDPALDFAGMVTLIQGSGAKLHGILGASFQDGAGQSAVGINGLGTAFLPDGSGGIITSTGGTTVFSSGATQQDYIDLIAALDPTSLSGDISSIAASPTTQQSFSLALTQTITAQAGSQAAPGDWRSIKLDKFSNDKNLGVVLETENSNTRGGDVNRTPQSAQFLGQLAPNRSSGDDRLRIGFEVSGKISLDDPTDVDVYSFQGQAGTEVWFDIDGTSSALDTIVELIDANGNVLARSQDNATLESFGVTAYSIIRDVLDGGDYNGVNRFDAGMRVVLPGTAGTPNTYFVRIRSNPAAGNIDDLSGGLTRGKYQLQVRLRQIDEEPGSVVQLADIRYATDGVEVYGLPAHSPLVSESSEPAGPNDLLGQSLDLGNLLASDLNTLNFGGALSSASDIDFYKFEIDYQLIQVIGGSSTGGKSWATVIDVDYADGMARPDSTLAVFDDTGTLILLSRESNVADDQPAPGQGTDFDDLTRGSAGKLDPFIGSLQMPEGTSKTYYVAIASNAQLPRAVDLYFQTGATNRTTRLEPISSIHRVIEDHIGFNGYTSGTGTDTAQIDPTQPTGLFDITSSLTLDTHIVPYEFKDLVLYVSTASDLYIVNPYTGATIDRIGGLGGNNTRDIAFRYDGRLFGYDLLAGNANHAGEMVEIDTGTAAEFNRSGGDGIRDYVSTNVDGNGFPNDPVGRLVDNTVDALAFRRQGTGNYDVFLSVRVGDHTPPPNGEVVFQGSSRLYNANTSGVSNSDSRGNPGYKGYIRGTGITGATTGMAMVGNTLYGVSTGGQFYTIDTSSGAAFLIRNLAPLGISGFSGLSLGPQNLYDGAYADYLIASTDGGRLYAIDINTGNIQPIFTGGSTTVSMSGLSGVTGVALSPLDFNLWHPTDRLGDVDVGGHGINPAFDNSRTPDANDRTIAGGDDSKTQNEQQGGTSLYFGFEQYSASNPNYFRYDGSNGQYGVHSGARFYQEDLSTNANLVNTYNMPGGAYGSLITNSFSLENYESLDRPTLYFNYFLQTQGAESPITAQQMRDSARVSISTDGGTTWQLLATNNSVLSPASGTPANELPAFLSHSASASSAANQQVQELFDAGQWRQARVDLQDYAGRSNLKMRVDFSTAGTMNQGLPGDATGDFSHADRARNNQFAGMYVDDFIIGFSERGEMVTSAPADQSSFFPVPTDPNPQAPTQQLTGTYQVEIRRGTETGSVIGGLLPDIVLGPQFDTNDRMADGRTIIAPAGSVITDGEGFSISDGLITRNFEFDNNGVWTSGSVRISFNASMTNDQVALQIRNAINGAGFGVSAFVTPTNNEVHLNNATSTVATGLLGNVTVTFAASSISESGSVQGTVTRDGATTADLVVNLNVLFNGSRVTLSPSTVTIPAGQASANFTVTGVDDAIAQGTETLVLRGVAASYASISGVLDITDNDVPTLGISLNVGTITETSVQGAAFATITRNTPTDVPLTVTVGSLDLSEAYPVSDATISEVEANNSLGAAQSLEAYSWSLLANNNISDSLMNTSRFVPHITINGTGNGTFDYYSFTAKAGQRAIFDIDGANFDTELFLYSSGGILLNSNDDSGLAAVDLGSATFDDSFLEHTFTADGTYIIGVGRFNSVGSGGGITGTTPANGDTYSLHVSMVGHAMPTQVQVVIPAGATSVNVPLNAVQDLWVDGDQSTTIIAYAPGMSAVTAPLTVQDVGSTPSLSLNILAASIAENAGAAATTGTVTLGATTTTDVVVSLIVSDASELRTPSTVVVLAGQLSATFSVAAIDDPFVDGSKTVVVTAASSGYAPSRDSITVTDAGGDSTNPTILSWTDQGPAPAHGGQQTMPAPSEISGAVQAIAVHPTNANIAYLGGANGGVWKTTNATAAAPTWVPLTDTMPSLSIGALELDPTDATGNTILAGIGMTSSFGAGGKLTGVIRSTDGGQNWQQLGTTALANQSITSVAARGNTLLAASDNTWAGLFDSTSLGDGLFRSIDAGVTWTRISGGTGTGLPAGRVSDLVADPTDPNTLFAAVRNSGIYRSTDQGATWSLYSNSSILVSGSTQKVEIAVHRAAGTTSVFAAVVANTGSVSGVYRSLNGGSFATLDLPASGGQGQVHLSIAAHPTDPNLVFVGGSAGTQYLTRIDASQAIGSQITNIATGTFNAPHVDTRELVFNANGDLLLGTDGGIYRLNTPALNTGAWSSLMGNLGVFEFHNVAYDSLSNVNFGGTQDNGTLMQRTTGQIWDLRFGGDGGDVAVDNVTLAGSNQSIRYYSSQFLGQTAGGQFRRDVYGPSNNLISSTNITPSTFTVSDSQFTTPIELNAINPQRMIIGGSNSVYESTNQGTTITRIASGIGVNGSGPQPIAYGGRRFGVNNVGVLYVGFNDDVYVRTSTAGTLAITSTLPAGADTIWDIALDPDDWQTAYVVDKDQVFLTTNAGTSWTDITGNLPKTQVQTVVVVGGSASGTYSVFIGTEQGVYQMRSNDSGRWTQYGTGLPNARVYELKYDTSDDKLVAGLLGRGVFATTGLGQTGYADVVATVTGPTSFSESSGTSATTVRVERRNAAGVPLTTGALKVTLTSSDSSEITVNGTGAPTLQVTIPDGQSFVDFTLDAVDDRLTDGTQTVTLIPSASGYNGIVATVDVLDTADDQVQTLTAQVIGPTTLSESGGTTTVRITRSSTDGDFQGTIVLSDTSEASSTPTNFTIPNGVASTDVTINATNDVLADGLQTVVVRGRQRGTGVDQRTYDEIGAAFEVTDNDARSFLSLTVSVANFLETAGAAASVGTLRLTNALEQDLVVSLVSSDTTEATVPATVTIPAGSTSVTFNIAAVNEVINDGTRPAIITAFARGFNNIGRQVNVTGVDDVSVGVEAYDRLGDRNLRRDQGHLLIDSNIIRNFAGTGVLIDAGTRDVSTDMPHPGSAINLPTLNNQRLAPGATVVNNLIYNVGQNGIVFSGDPNLGNVPLAVVPYGKIMNNTVYGSGSAKGTGILVTENASPTLINNLIANTVLGISIDGSSSSTVVGTTLFQGNTNDGVLGTNSIQVPAGTNLFTDPATGNFYLQPGTPAIDSSLNKLDDRFTYVAVKSAVGLPPSDVVAPSRDVFGQLRQDDPNQAPPPGLGLNIFKDRGAVDRVDYVGPFGELVLPADNDSLNADIDRNKTVVQLTSGIYRYFDITLSDGAGLFLPFDGTGVDAFTVVPNAISITRDGQFLNYGTDWLFGYSGTSDILRIEPLAGIWRPGSAYQITLNNKDRLMLTAPLGASAKDGTPVTVTDSTGAVVTYEYETGFNLTVPKTLAIQIPAEGAGTGGITDGEQFSVTDGTLTRVFEFDRNSNVSPGNTAIPFVVGWTQDQVANAVVSALASSGLGLSPRNLGFGDVHLGSKAIHSIDTTGSSLTQSGVAAGVEDGMSFAYTHGASTITFEFEDLDVGDGVTAGNVALPFRHNNTNVEIGEMIAQALRGAGLGLDAASHLFSGLVHVGGQDGDTLDATSAPQLTLSGAPGISTGYHLEIPAAGAGVGGIADGETFTVSLAGGASVRFEFDNNNSVASGNTKISFVTGDTQDDIAATVVNVIGNAGLSLNPVYLGNGIIELNETNRHLVDVSTSPSLVLSGVAGGAVGINFDASYTDTEVAALIQAAINQSAKDGFLTGVAARPRGGATLFVDGAVSVTGIDNEALSAIKDLAGNPLQGNQRDGETRFTILMPGVVLDYGDAALDNGSVPGSFPTVRDPDDGARHVVYEENPIYLGATVDVEANGQPSVAADGDGADEDGVTFGGPLGIPFNPLTRQTPITVTAQGAGFLDAWFDWNRDNDWDDAGEHALQSIPLVDGVNVLSVSTPVDGAIGNVAARFRYSLTGGLFARGISVGGEVEDYLIDVKPGTPPVAIQDNYSVNEDTLLTTNAVTGVLFNDTDADAGDSAQTALLVPGEGPQHAQSFTLNANGTFSYMPAPDFYGIDTFQYRAKDTTGLISNEIITVTITVNAVNDAPVNTIPGTQAGVEDNSVTFSAAQGNALSIADDSGNNPIQVQLTVVGGTATLGGTAGLTVSGDGTAVVSVTGTLVDINAALQGLIFNPSLDFNGNATIEVKTTDQGFTGGSLPGLTDTDTITISVAAVNDAPVNSAPASQVMSEDIPLVFNTANGNRISISDDSLGSVINVTLTAVNGVLHLGDPTGGGNPLFSAAGNGTASVVMSGPLAAINTALDNLSFSTALNYNGSGSLTIFVDDLGNTGTGGPLNDQDTVSITVAAVNDAPVNAVPGPQSVLEDNSLIFSAGRLISISDVDALANPVRVTLTGVNGLVTLNGTAGLTFLTGDGGADPTMSFTGTIATINARLNGLTFAPLANFDGTALLVITTSDLGSIGNGGPQSDTDTVTISVSPVNDAPVITAPTSQSTPEDTPRVFNSANGNLLAISDDSASGAIVVELTPTNGTLVPATTANLSVIVGAGGKTTLTGALVDINAALNGLSFVPTGNYSGPASLVVNVNDQGNTGVGGAKTAAATVSLTVTSVNDPPLNTIPGTQTTNDEEPVTFSAANVNAISVSDVDAGSGSIRVTLNAIDGLITLATTTGLSFTVGDGTSDANMNFTGTLARINAALDGLRFRPNDYFAGNAQLIITSNDLGLSGAGGQQTDTDTVTINVLAVNDAPVNTVPPTQTLPEDGSLTFGTAFGNRITVADDAGTNPIRMTMSVPTGTLTLPASAALGNLTFINGTANGQGTLDFTGTLTNINAALDGLKFQPVGNFNGSVLLTVTTDDLGNSPAGSPPYTDSDTVTLTVTAVNDAPVNTIPSGTPTVIEDGTLSFAAGNFAVADLDAGSGDIRVTLSSAQGNLTLSSTAGLASVSGNGTGSLVMTGSQSTITTVLGGLSFAPAANFYGDATIVIATNDQGLTGAGPSGGLTATDTVTVSVTPVNDPPVNSLPSAQTVAEDGTLTLSGATALSVQDDSGASSIQVTLTGTRGTVTLASTTGLTLIGTGTNDYLVVMTGSLANVNAALNGLKFRPDANYVGAASIAISTNDLGNTGGGANLTDTDTLAITVTDVNDAPVNNVPSSSTTPEDVTLLFSNANGNQISIDDIDAGSGILAVTLVVPNSDGTVTLGSTAGLASVSGNGSSSVSLSGTLGALNNALNGLAFTPKADASGNFQLVLTTNDQGNTGGGNLIAKNTITIAVTAVNDPPVASPVARSTVEDTPLTVAVTTLMANDVPGPSNESSQTLTFGGVVSPTANGGTVAVVSGNVVYTPAANFNGTDTFVYRITDNGLTNGVADPKTSLGTVTVTVSPVNDAPVAVNDNYVMDEDTTLVRAAFNGVRANDFDVENSPLTVTRLSGPTASGSSNSGSLNLGADGSFTYIPPANYFGTVTFTYRVNDGQLNSNTATVTITVNNVNEPPVAANDAVDAPLGGFVDADVLGNDSDVDGTIDSTTVAVVTSPTRGTATVNPDGTIRYTPSGSSTGTDTFSYTVKDNTGAVSNAATVTVTIVTPPPVWQNSINRLDVNADGFVTPLDPLLIINELNLNSLNLPPDRRLPVPGNPPPYYDVNGDGFLTPQDSLIIINFLNGTGAGEGEGEGPDATEASSTVVDINWNASGLVGTPLAAPTPSAGTTSESPAQARRVRDIPVIVTGASPALVPTVQAASDEAVWDAWEDTLDDLAGEVAGRAEQNAVDAALDAILGG